MTQKLISGEDGEIPVMDVTSVLASNAPPSEYPAFLAGETKEHKMLIKENEQLYGIAYAHWSLLYILDTNKASLSTGCCPNA